MQIHHLSEATTKWENILGSQREEIPSGRARERVTAEETLDLRSEEGVAFAR